MRHALLFTPAFVASLAFVGIAQLIVASSTFFIANLAKSVTDGTLSLPYLIGFVASLTLVLIPLYFASIFLEKAKFDSLARYNTLFDKHFLGKSCHYNNHTLKHTATAMLSQESKHTLDDSLLGVFDMITLLLNVGFNLIVIAWVLDGFILLGYGVGMVLAMGAVHLFKDRLGNLAKTAQMSQLMLMSGLSKAWDNVIIFNKYNYLRHNRTLTDTLNTAKTDSIHAKSTRHLSSNVGMLVLLVCVLTASGVLFWQNLGDMTMLAMLVATLPRQIQMLQMSHELIGYRAEISTLMARLDGLIQLFDTPNATLDKYIKKDRIFVKQTNQAFDFDEFLKNPPSTGRITLVGDNGVGKSCVLLTLKNRLGERAYYLPAKHELIFDNTEGSTGQRLIVEIDKLTGDDTPILLLDEWDANLDGVNTDIIHAKLDEIGKTRLIVEVRH
ncbi:ABC transporter ATP-binding protein [Moraxella equi]|uniref:Uncharacterized protein n=1 Tax=Moraxella equi TaxID=60442 RepID=A0A378QUJ8_9GAMM|nr:ABC transporter ATP-binding protein [Moraxella equi]OPH34083.1 hypothetical protein B5J93_12230 [Moraxella equi]STZ04112.1 Uncharacterised protein [Moraxella equi]